MNVDGSATRRGSTLSFFLLALSAAILVAFVYWPAVHASFVWDDLLVFHEAAWLRHGNDWVHDIMRGFSFWSRYFRPLTVVFFTVEVRIFDVRPGPMHAVSIALHVINTILVGLYAKTLSFDKSPNANRWYVVLLPMLLYGLHPLLIEPVMWIGCQTDLVAVLFMLLGLISNAKFRRPWIRAVSVALCFFMSACSKESALAFPFLLVLFDWFNPTVAQCSGVIAQFKQLLKLNKLVYAISFLAGVVYLVLRHIALGTLLPYLGNQSLPLVAHAQQISFLYVRFWHMLVWPMDGLSPVHPVPMAQFLSINTSSVFDVVLSVAIALTGLICVLRRRYVGGFIVAVTFALLPVLHILSVGYDQSLYHERYAMPALAMACAWLPATLLVIRVPSKIQHISVIAGFTAAVLWMILGAMNVRATIPLWSTPLNLWEWAFSLHPDAIEVNDALIGTYIDLGDNSQAWRLIDKVIADRVPCTNCLLNGAELAISENRLDRAAYFLDLVKNSPDLHRDKVMSRFYQAMCGELELLQGDALQAEKSARVAISIDDLNPSSHLLLAMALAKQGRLDEARQEENAAVSLSAPDERKERRLLYENWVRRVQVNPAVK